MPRSTASTSARARRRCSAIASAAAVGVAALDGVGDRRVPPRGGLAQHAERQRVECVERRRPGVLDRVAQHPVAARVRDGEVETPSPRGGTRPRPRCPRAPGRARRGSCEIGVGPALRGEPRRGRLDRQAVLEDLDDARRLDRARPLGDERAARSAAPRHDRALLLQHAQCARGSSGARPPGPARACARPAGARRGAPRRARSSAAAARPRPRAPPERERARGPVPSTYGMHNGPSRTPPPGTCRTASPRSPTTCQSACASATVPRASSAGSPRRMERGASCSSSTRDWRRATTPSRRP